MSEASDEEPHDSGRPKFREFNIDASDVKDNPTKGCPACDEIVNKKWKTNKSQHNAQCRENSHSSMRGWGHESKKS